MEEFKLEEPRPAEVKEQFKRLRLSFCRPKRPARKEKENKLMSTLKQKERKAIKNGYLKYKKG